MDTQLGGDVFPSDTACNRATSAIKALLTVPDMPVGERYDFPTGIRNDERATYRASGHPRGVGGYRCSMVVIRSMLVSD
jgi:hypothetical protein